MKWNYTWRLSIDKNMKSMPCWLHHETGSSMQIWPANMDTGVIQRQIVNIFNLDEIWSQQKEGGRWKCLDAKEKLS